MMKKHSEPKSTASSPRQGDPSVPKTGKFDHSRGQTEHALRVQAAMNGDKAAKAKLIEDAVRSK